MKKKQKDKTKKHFEGMERETGVKGAGIPSTWSPDLLLFRFIQDMGSFKMADKKRVNKLSLRV